MFDNLQQQNNNKYRGAGNLINKTQQNNPGSASTLNDTDKTSPELDDIFAETEEKTKPEIFQPKQQVKNSPQTNESINNNFGNVHNSTSTPMTEPLPAETDNNGTKYMILGVFVIVILLIGLTAWFFLGKYTDKEETIIPLDTETNDLMQDDDQQIENTTGTNTVKQKQTDVQTKKETMETQDIDSDNDGLTDNEEAAIGTDKFKEDTDNDGLFDREEVRVYKTDPLDPDTDKDGYPDGSEVKNGYNPNGQGKLFNLSDLNK